VAARKKAPPADPVGDYARAVLAGTIVTGRLVRLACERHLRDIEEGPARGLRFDDVTAARAIGFFPAVLRHSKGQFAGQPFELLAERIRADDHRRWKIEQHLPVRPLPEDGEGEG
jgi:hypothetical protein